MNTIGKILFWIDVHIFILVTLGNVRPGETISAASWSLKLDGKRQGKIAVPIIDFLSRCLGDGPNHCQRAYVWQQDLYKAIP